MCRRKVSLPRVKSTPEWQAYFDHNRKRLRPIPWEEDADISETERAVIGKSLQAWQLGETSDGSNLLAAARKHAEKIGDPDFVEVIRMFIAEENRHGDTLGRFLDLAKVGRVNSNWGDTIFRLLRHVLPGMELRTVTILMVEALALVYYNLIRRTTESAVLRIICEQILADEVPHIRFQCERLAILHRHRPWWLRTLSRWMQRPMFAGVALAVWIGHRRAFRAGGYTFSTFWKASWRKMRQAWKMMDPTQYEWEEEGTKEASGGFIPAGTVSQRS